MDNQLLQALFQKVVFSADRYTDTLSVFGVDAPQSRRAYDRYVACFDLWKRERHWEKFCAMEGPWAPECRMYEC